MSSINNNKQHPLYTESYDTLSWVGEGLLSWPIKAICKIAETAVYVLEFGAHDIDSDTLKRYRTTRLERSHLSVPFPKAKAKAPTSLEKNHLSVPFPKAKAKAPTSLEKNHLSDPFPQAKAKAPTSKKIRFDIP